MYEVIVRKSLRYPDGTTASEESQEKVNHERHALNLAAKIARNDNVEWVQIEELSGRFKAHASRAPDGTVDESLQSPRYKIQRKRSFRPAGRKRVRRVVLLCLVGFAALGYLMVQHRAGTVSGPGIASTPMEGLPSRSRQEQERARPATRPKKESLPGRNVTQAERKEPRERDAESGATARGESHPLATPPEESTKPPVPPAGSPPPIPPKGPTSAAESQPGQSLWIFLTDPKSREAAGGFGQESGAAAGAHRSVVHPPKTEFVKAFREHCPTVVVTMQPDKADYLVTLDHSTWHSPPYRVVVLSREGHVIYSGGTQLLRNAVKDACEALAARR